jgi:O-antigen/teichoic acid export membrane protein
MAISGLALAVRDFATTDFIIQKKELRTADVRTAFTVLFLLTLAISVVLYASAGPISDFYGDRRLVPFLHVVALCILINVIFEPVAAMLRRHMQFQRLAVLNVTTAAITSATTIALVFLGFSYMSFVWGWLTSAIIVSSLAVLVWKDRSIYRPCLEGWRDFVAFSSYHGANILFYRLYDSLPYLVLGRTLSLHAVALYNRGITVCQLPDKVLLGGVASVLLSSYAAEVRGGGNLAKSYLRAIEMITALQWPGLLLLAILAHPIVTLMLGPQWTGAVPLVQIMAVALLFSFSAELNYPMLVAFGAMRDVLVRSLIVWPLSALIIAAASLFGLKATALAWLITIPLQAYISVYFVQRHVPVTWRQVGGALWRSAVLALLTCVGPVAVVLFMDGDFNLPPAAVLVAILLAGLGWCAGLVLTAHPLREEIVRATAVVTAMIQRHRAALADERTAKGLRRAPG